MKNKSNYFNALHSSLFLAQHTNDMPSLIGVSLGDNISHYRSIEEFMKFYSVIIQKLAQDVLVGNTSYYPMIQSHHELGRGANNLH